jgi:hypothetical protein
MHVTLFAARISLAMQNRKNSDCMSLFPRAISVPTFSVPLCSANHHAIYRYSLEKLGKFYLMLEAGMHILVPFVDQITFTRCLKTGLLDCPPQVRQFKHAKIDWHYMHSKPTYVHTARHHKRQRFDCSRRGNHHTRSEHVEELLLCRQSGRNACCDRKWNHTQSCRNNERG